MSKRIALTVIAVFSGLLFAASSCKVVSILATAAKEKSAFDELAAMVDRSRITEETAKDTPAHLSAIPAEDTTEGIPGTPQTDEPEAEPEPAVRTILPEYAAIYEQNNDFFAWLSIDGTAINYPVMFTPQDPQYYLRRAFDKSDATVGTPFLNSECSEEGGIYIVYGHYTRNGTMFGSLAEYAEKDYWKEHKTIRFDTLYERGEYKVLAAFYSRVYTPMQKGFRYYAYTDLSYEVIFNSYIEQVAESALYDTGVTAEFGDTLLVLSTCDYYMKDGRFVVVARKHNKP